MVHEAPGAEHVIEDDAVAQDTCNIGVVIVTHNRRVELVRSIERLRALPARPRIVVVDNGSHDGTADCVDAIDDVELVSLPVNLGASARTVGVRLLDTPLVTFCDDDSWWDAGSFAVAERLFRACPDVGLVMGRILLDDAGREDPICERLRLPAAELVRETFAVLHHAGRGSIPALLDAFRGWPELRAQRMPVSDQTIRLLRLARPSLSPWSPIV